MRVISTSLLVLGTVFLLVLLSAPDLASAALGVTWNLDPDSELTLPNNYNQFEVEVNTDALSVDLIVTIYIPAIDDLDLASTARKPVLFPIDVIVRGLGPGSPPHVASWHEEGVLGSYVRSDSRRLDTLVWRWRISHPWTILTFQLHSAYILPIELEIQAEGYPSDITSTYTAVRPGMASRDLLPLSIVPAWSVTRETFIPNAIDVIISSITPYTTRTTSDWLGLDVRNMAAFDQPSLMRAWDKEGNPMDNPGALFIADATTVFFNNLPRDAHTVALRFTALNDLPETFDYSYKIGDKFEPTTPTIKRSSAFIRNPTNSIKSPLLSLSSVAHAELNTFFTGERLGFLPHDELVYKFHLKALPGGYTIFPKPVGHLLDQLTFMDCTLPQSVSNPVFHYDPTGLDFWVSFTIGQEIAAGGDLEMSCTAVPSPFLMEMALLSNSKYEYLAVNVVMEHTVGGIAISSTPPPLLMDSPNLSQFFDGGVLKPVSIIAQPPIYGLVDPYTQNLANWNIIVTFPGVMPATALTKIIFKPNPLFTIQDMGAFGCYSRALTTDSPTQPVLTVAASIVVGNRSGTWEMEVYNPDDNVRVAMRCELRLRAVIDHYPTATHPSFQYFPASSITTDNILSAIEIEYIGRPVTLTVPKFQPGHIFDTTLKMAPSFNPFRPLPRTTTSSIPFEFTIHPTVRFQPTAAEVALSPKNSIWVNQLQAIVFEDTVINLVITSPSLLLQSGTTISLPNNSPHWRSEVQPANGNPSTAMIGLARTPAGDLTLTQDVVFPINFRCGTANDLDLTATITVTNALSIQSTMNSWGLPIVLDLFAPSPMQFVVPLEPTKEHLGTASFLVVSTPASIPITRLVDAPLIPLPSIKPTFDFNPLSSLHVTFTPSATTGGFQTQEAELWYLTPNNREVLIQALDLQTFKLQASGYTNAFIKCKYPYPNLPGIYHETNSYRFDILPRCMKITVPATATTQAKIESNCPNPKEICIPTTGLCQGRTVATVPEPSVSTSKCSKCDQTNTAVCTAAIAQSGSAPAQQPTCSCKDGWTGLTCQQSVASTAQCAKPQSPKCNLENGFVAPGPGGENKCSASTCTCYNNWAGSNCQSCSLQCLNNGVNYKDCARCGCTSGFAGSQCQCQGVTGTVTLNGFSEVLIKNRGQLSTSTVAFFDNTNQLLTPLSTLDDIVYIAIMEELFLSFRQSLTNSETGSFGFSLKPTVVQNGVDADGQPQQQASTIFTFQITFNCADSNPHITSMAQLAAQWGNFVDGLGTNKAILKHFTFETGAPASAEGNIELTPTTPTLPTERETLVNAGFGRPSFFHTLVITLFVSLVTIANISAY